MLAVCICLNLYPDSTLTNIYANLFLEKKKESILLHYIYISFIRDVIYS
jgi:hypothetical protein